MAHKETRLRRYWPLLFGMMMPLALFPWPGASQAHTAGTIAEGGNSTGFDMAPETRIEVVEAAVAATPSKIPPGPYRSTWESLRANYRVPQWFVEAKFGLFLHWGLYTVPAYHNEWYEKHMYGAFIQWHLEHFGPQNKFGYKEFIPLFTAEKFDNGVDIRYMDPLKLQVAAFYYNRAQAWGKEVSLSTKKAAYAPSNRNTEQIGSIVDFEKIGSRSPAGIRTGVWQVDEPIGSSWGYTKDMRVAGAAAIIAKLADTVSKI